MEVLFDSTVFIEESVHELELELAMAVALTALVCWLFLGSLSSTMNVVLAIPMSLLGTIAVVYFCGFTLNTFTLLGRSLAVGLVVDDAVMVMENIFRHAEMGKDSDENVRAAVATRIPVDHPLLSELVKDSGAGRCWGGVHRSRVSRFRAGSGHLSRHHAGSRRPHLARRANSTRLVRSRIW